MCLASCLTENMHGRGRGRGGGPMPFSHGGMASDDDMRADKTMRSIFGIMVESSNPGVVYIIASSVANVGFDTTEEQLGTLLSEVGPILNLK